MVEAVTDVKIGDTPIESIEGAEAVGPTKKKTEHELKQLFITSLESSIPPNALSERRGYILASAAQALVGLIGGDAELKTGAHVKVIEPLHQDLINLVKHAIAEYTKRRDHLTEVGHMVPSAILRRYLDEHADAKESQVIAKILRDDVRG